MIVSADRAPISFRVAKWMQRKGIRGGFRLQQMAQERGYLNVCVTYPLSGRVSFSVPLAMRTYDEDFVRTYEKMVLDAFSDGIRAVPGDYTFIDCGADLGLMACRIAAAEPSIKRVIAFEPNDRIFGYLQTNLAALPAAATAFHGAVADFEGRGDMHFPEHDSNSEHARFLVPDPTGSIPVTTVDAQAIPAGSKVILKIDVEGGELAVVNGAARTLASADHFIIVFEAQRDQVARCGIDPIEIVARLAQIASIDVSIADAPGLAMDWTKPFFSQIGTNTFTEYKDTFDICVTKRRP